MIHSHEPDEDCRDGEERGGEHGLAREPRGPDTAERAPRILRLGEVQDRGSESRGDECETEESRAPRRMARDRSGGKKLDQGG
jgi:hypothetical protein